MKKFEYKVISVPRAIPIGAKGYEKMVTEFETNLNKLGAEGWELVQRADDFLFFKSDLYVELIPICLSVYGFTFYAMVSFFSETL